METLSDGLVGVLVAILGATGLFLAANAIDVAILIFGVSLGLFSVLFIAGIIKRQLTIRSRARAVVGGVSHG